jgi:hypothetical protein
MRKMKKTVASLFATTLLAVGVAAPTASAQQEADGLVVVQIDDTNVNVVVPINAAVGIAANVCDVNVPITVAVLAAVDQDLDDAAGGTCEARSPVFAGQELTITNNN